MGLYENIKNACSERGISINKLEIELGLPRSSISKYNKNSPSIDKVQRIADFLEFPLEYLTTGEKEESPIYYTNKETAAVAQKIFEEDKVLFDVYRSTDKDRLVEYAKKLKALRDMEEGNV